MTREDIEKAAEQNISCHTEFDFAEILANLGRECFCYGAEWRINSVWHSNERPVPGKLAVVEYLDGGNNKNYRIDKFSGYEWIAACHYDRIIRYAYIEDLIPPPEE